MISITGKKWEEIRTNKNAVDKIKQDHNFSDILSKLIISRNFDEDEMYSIENDIEIKNIFLNTIDFNKSIELVVEIINKQESICILGDYDVDGSAATSLIARYLQGINHPFFFYIPDREKDGYGASKKLFEKLIIKKPKLVIMVDCGSTSNEAIDFLNQNNIKSLIIDHHEMSKPFPKANVIINPKKNDDYRKYDYLCATTLTYFFLDLLNNKIKSKINLSDYLIYVLLATVCDVMPLRKLNRLISLNVIKNFKITENYIFNVLYNLNNKKNRINVTDLGYLIGPIINAGGRLGKSNYATELLSSNDPKIINDRSIELIKLNEKRKNIEKLILNDIDFNKIAKDNKDIIIYYNPKINEGLIGIIAARLKDHFNKPSIVITCSNSVLKGSARSIYNYNIGKVIKSALSKKIILGGGGHDMAGGFTLYLENLDNFKNFMYKDFVKSCVSLDHIYNYDAEISPTAFNKDFFYDIKKIEPFGIGNPIPTFLFKDLKIIKTTILNKKHISSIFKSKIGFSINSICFNSIDNTIGEHLLNYKNELSVLGQINENIWNNKNSLQLIVKDLVIKGNKT